jgi:chemotaxis protein CheD
MRPARRRTPAVATCATPLRTVLRETPVGLTAAHSVYLHPGQQHASADPCVITTILGSCVSVCLFDAGRRVGGANHFLLPQHGGDGNEASRYGPTAVRRLRDRLMELGAHPEQLEARVVGGANMLSAFHNGERHLGLRNVDVARQVLAEVGIPIVAEDVGGTRGRKLAFSTSDGTTWVRFI